MAESVFGSSARFCGLPWIRLYLAFLGEKPWFEEIAE
jgi:hypothetical protein